MSEVKCDHDSLTKIMDVNDLAAFYKCDDCEISAEAHFDPIEETK